MKAKTVGMFSCKDGIISGPAKYMDQQGSAYLRKIEAGESAVANYGMIASPDLITAVLVAMQTDYAAWQGMQTLLARQHAGVSKRTEDKRSPAQKKRDAYYRKYGSDHKGLM